MIISAAKASEAAEVLGVSLDGLTPNILSRAYRNKAKECHPDHHGQAKLAQWARVSWAKECLDRRLEQNPEPVSKEIANTGDCRACGGTGRVRIGKGFGKGVTMHCVLCRGTGSVEPEENDSDAT